MKTSIKINELTDLPALNLALDTINIGKQALVFCNTKRTAEATAEKISLKVKTNNEKLNEMANHALHALTTPTKQCKRLALCLKKGIAFHHSGLAHQQRKLIEDNFRAGLVKIICCTPTLAFGLNLPAFRAIMKDLKRYGGRWGMEWIPTLEYHQCIGRAGRPDFNDKFGEAICIVSDDAEKETVLQRFLLGEPEPILSKLAVEPVLRTYVLSLVATNFVRTKQQLLEFFERTFYAHHYKDINEIDMIISKIIDKLDEWEFIKTSSINNSSEFISADEFSEIKLEATKLGMRVSQLYIDPLTANFIITCMRRATQVMVNEFSFLHMIANTIELRPYFRVRTKEINEIEEELSEHSSQLIVLEPSVYEPEYDEFLNATKTAIVLNEWLEEKDEEFLLERYSVRPGEFNYKKGNADWILYASEELAKLLQFRDIVRTIKKTRFRLKHGIKEELIPLVRIKGIGRVRARKLFRNGIKDIGDIKNTDLMKLSQLIGRGTALKIKKEVGIDIEKEEIPKGKRKGQLGLGKY
ncbi:hypothetical protein JXB41_04265 [Candidatus Woesearchaeota archaeon]|nr:hypothetical protein [Candidatus Woesearchaeota archaeon]